jgi:outer membrane receptor protein involved in Fe transport
LIPTLDPFTNNIKLDLFPASFVDNIVITKTASPDLQGDWSAAYISLETKDRPEQFTLFVETKVGYIPQTSFKKVITNQTSPTDWLGFDNGFRDIDHDKVVEVKSSPTTYEELCALGLDDFYRSIGVTQSWAAGSTLGETYFKLGLIELGLLGKAYINDGQAVSKAKSDYYTGEYQNVAFRNLNQEAEQSLDQFANNWDTFEETAPLNFTQTFSIGNQTSLFGKPFSFLGGFRYGNATQYDPEAQLTRTISSDRDSLGNPYFIQQYDQQFARYTSGWTGLATANFKLNGTNSFSLMFMPNVVGTNAIREGVDQVGSTTYRYAFLQGQMYEERSQFVYQYASEHYIPATKMKVQLSASYADGESTAPDFKSLQYFSEDSINYVLDKTISNVRRNFRYLDEDILDAKFTLEFPLRDSPGLISKLKFGLSYLDKQREFIQYDYLLTLANGVTTDFTNGQLNQLFSDEKFDIRLDSASGRERIDMFYRPFDDPANHTIGYTNIYSGFGMIDQSITEKIRVSGGLRAEYSEISTDVKQFADLGYAADDLRRRTPEQAFTLKPGQINRWDFLPSINFIYRLRADDILPSNLRLNYSRSVARPSTREYTETIVRDFELNADVFGNADLKFVQVDNYDVRYENYLKTGNYFSVSLFYKNFKNHIELTSSNFGFTWANADQSNVYGIELEGRVALSERFEFRSNISLVKSYTKVEDRRLVIENGTKSWVVLGIIERNMFGQAPYVLNAILNYTSLKGFSASLSYNIQGPKLVLTSIDESPDIYEMPRHLLNLKLAQPLGKRFNLSFTIKDILNTQARRSYKYDEGYLLDFDRFRYGTEYALAIAYTLNSSGK